MTRLDKARAFLKANTGVVFNTAGITTTATGQVNAASGSLIGQVLSTAGTGSGVLTGLTVPYTMDFTFDSPPGPVPALPQWEAR